MCATYSLSDTSSASIGRQRSITKTTLTTQMRLEYGIYNVNQVTMQHKHNPGETDAFGEYTARPVIIEYCLHEIATI